MIFGQRRVTQKKLDNIINNQPLLLVASLENRPIGFKLGYVIPGTLTWFSWLGGIHPDFRQRGIAQQLLNQQEKHAETLGLDKIYFTTFDQFAAMINLGQKNDYHLIRSEFDDGELKYWYQKSLPKS